jgi:hypothetical protein
MRFLAGGVTDLSKLTLRAFMACLFIRQVYPAG